MFRRNRVRARRFQNNTVAIVLAWACPFVNAHEQQIEAAPAEDITTDDEILLSIRAVLDPRALIARRARWRTRFVCRRHLPGQACVPPQELVLKGPAAAATGAARLTARKTGKSLLIPIAAPLREHLLTMETGDNPRSPVHPRAFEIVSTQNGRTGTLSNQFADLLRLGGVARNSTLSTKW